MTNGHEFLVTLQNGPNDHHFVNDIVVADDLDVIVQSLSSTLLRAFDIHAPVCSFVAKKPPVPWLTDELKIRIHNKNSLYKLAKRNSDLLTYEIYRITRKPLNSDIKIAKRWGKTKLGKSKGKIEDESPFLRERRQCIRWDLVVRTGLSGIDRTLVRRQEEEQEEDEDEDEKVEENRPDEEVSHTAPAAAAAAAAAAATTAYSSFLSEEKVH
ncbi:hypothetical protein M0802_009702 [Mischocyttarus mexicanus]|nr:hypothetical protein M0802_009702 [Mischocyttarus mexicanus]